MEHLKDNQGPALLPKRGRLSLGAKFILLSSSLILITVFVIGLFSILKQEQDNYELLLDHGRSVALMIADSCEYGISHEDPGRLRAVLDIIQRDPSIAYVFILDIQERILTYTTAESHPIHIPPLEEHVHSDNGTEVLHQSYRNKEDGKHYLNIMVPVIPREKNRSVLSDWKTGGREQGTPIGYIHLGLSQEATRARISRYIYSILLFTTLIIGIGIATTIFITRRIIAPINQLNQATQDIAEGRLDRQIDIRTNDEVSDLAQAFNHMQVRLQRSHTEVERQTMDLMVALERMRQEIGERVRTEQALKDSERKYRAIFEESKDVIFICSPDGRFQDINPAGAELFGYPSPEDLERLDPVQLYESPEDHSVLQRLLERQGFVKDHEVRMRRSDGRSLIVLVTASIIRSQEGVLSNYRGVFHNVTEKRTLEQQLVQSQKMEAIGQLAGGIAHDFNNILTAIMGYANLLLLDLPEEGGPLTVHAEHILSSAERAANLTRSLLSFSRKQVLTPKPVDLNAIVTTIQKLLLRLIGEDIELRTNLDTNGATILADSGQIEQVLINLCTNARDAMPGGGIITISTSTIIVRESLEGIERPGAYALIAVSDTGSGIDGSIREKIFEPFFTTKETGKGTGLGLSIVYGIVKQHNGYIDLQSEPATGTTFKVYLPLAGGTRAPADQKKTTRPKGGNERILVAEDDPEVRKLIRLILAGSGYTVIEAEDGQRALVMLSERTEKVHLLLLDVIMPKKNGKEVYDTVRLSDPTVKAIFMSGYTADIIDKKGILDGNLNFLPKPIEPLELLGMVRNVLDG